MERLKKYLDDVRTFLPGTNPKKVDEILREIESHVLERAEREHGEVNDTAVAMSIKEYGSPEEVAARYYEGGPKLPLILRTISSCTREFFSRFTSDCILSLLFLARMA